MGYSSEKTSGLNRISKNTFTDNIIRVVAETEANQIWTEDNKYKKYMCSNDCGFYQNKTCIKGRLPNVCARLGLKNKE